VFDSFFALYLLLFILNNNVTLLVFADRYDIEDAVKNIHVCDNTKKIKSMKRKPRIISDIIDKNCYDTILL